MKKIVLLGKMMELGTFTLAEISQAAGVNTATAQTVITRCPGDWLNVEIKSTGAKGGQPKLYRLTEEGRSQIQAQLALLQLPAAPPARRAATEDPASLVLATSSVTRLRAAFVNAPFDNDRLEFLRDEAWGNLQWAAHEADTPDLELRIAVLRQDVLTLENERLERRVREFDRAGRVPVVEYVMPMTALAAVSRGKLGRMAPADPQGASAPRSLLRMLFSGLQHGAAAPVGV